MKTKKILSFLLAAVLMVGCIGISASAAEGTVTVSLLGENQAVRTEEYEVIINVEEPSEDTVGGIYCEISYDAADFTYKRLEVNEDFAAINGSDEKIVSNNAAAGVVKIVLLDVPNDGKKSNWLTVVFGVNANASSETADFSFKELQISDAIGNVELITNNLKVEIADKAIYDHTLNVNGASIRKDASGNIRFEAQLDTDVKRSQIEKFGFLMVPAACLKGKYYNGDLTFTNDGKYTTATGATATIASGEKDISELKADEDKFYCYLTNTEDYSYSMSFAARAYIKLTDGTIIYSDNQEFLALNSYKKDIKGGTSSKSCIAVAKAIYELYSNEADLSAIENIIEKTSWTDDDYKAVVSALAAVEDTDNSFN